MRQSLNRHHFQVGSAKSLPNFPPSRIVVARGPMHEVASEVSWQIPPDMRLQAMETPDHRPTSPYPAVKPSLTVSAVSTG